MKAIQIKAVFQFLVLLSITSFSFFFFSYQPIKDSRSVSINSLSINALSSHEIDSKTLELNLDGTSGLEKTADGREFLKYLARCALPEGKELNTAVDGVTYTFVGGIGLTPEWLNSPLTPSGERWISACMLAHVNAFGIKVPISIRSSHPVLRTLMSDEATGYPVEEAAFYGNIFEDLDKKYVCKGDSHGSKSKYLNLRVCSDVSGQDNITRCDFQSMGSCRESNNFEEGACQEFNKDGSYFTLCKGGETVYDEVITVYLKKN